MLKLNVNEEKQLTFEVQIGGVHQESITSNFKVILGEVEYGFPAKVGRDVITVDLPPLNKVIGAKISEGDEAEVRLEIVADGHYLTPWQDNAKLSNPLVVEAKIKDSGFTPNPTLQTKLVVSEDGRKQKVTVEEKSIDPNEALEERIVDRLSTKLQTLIKEQAEGPVANDEEEEKQGEEEVEEKCEVKEEKVVEEDTAATLERLLDKTIDTLKLNESDKKKKGMTLEEFKKNLSESDVYKYIEKNGTKNPEIQKIIFEQARVAAKKDTPAHILKSVVEIMKKK